MLVLLISVSAMCWADELLHIITSLSLAWTVHPYGEKSEPLSLLNSG